LLWYANGSNRSSTTVWTNASPFHIVEIAVAERLGVAMTRKNKKGDE